MNTQDNEIVSYLKQDPLVRQRIKDYLTEYSKQNLVTQAQRGKELVAIAPVVMEAVKIMSDDIYELSIENDVLRDKMGNVDEEWLKATKTNIMGTATNDTKNKL